LGHARHGKDTFAEILEVSFRSSSKTALDVFLFDILNDYRDDIGIPAYKTKDEAFEDRVNWRSMWHQEISNYNKNDRAKLAKKIIGESDCYVGMRCNLEYQECVNQELFDYVFWVDASHREAQECSSSMNIEFDKTKMIFVDNNFDLAHLEILAGQYKSLIGYRHV